jgi:ABC-type Fe3+/spermidine/putrescine transport system ATPase subunit
MATVKFDDASRIHPGNDTPSVDKLNLDIADGEFLVLVGPSGCGKSTSLRMLAGLEEVNAGDIWIGDRNVTELSPKDRDVAMVFQNYALHPHGFIGTPAMNLFDVPVADGGVKFGSTTHPIDGRMPPEKGAVVHLSPKGGHVHLFHAETGLRLGR